MLHIATANSTTDMSTDMSSDISSQRIAHAHDAFVRTVMSDPRIAREFFTVHLPVRR
jgi:hypothetical protein